jgi:hypothetical protein
MSFLRPEARAMIWRLREVIAAVVLTAALAWWAVSSFGVMRWIVLTLALLSLVCVIAALQRARFVASGSGAGLVEVDEGVVSYLTALTGGQVEISEITSVTLLPALKGPAQWQIEAPGQSPLLIPLDAVDAEKLFDVFVSLDGIETEKMLRQIKHMPDTPVVIWHKPMLALH